jgi:hypothetical protein
MDQLIIQTQDENSTHNMEKVHRIFEIIQLEQDVIAQLESEEKHKHRELDRKQRHQGELECKVNKLGQDLYEHRIVRNLA